MRITDTVALVTGANRGLGRAFAAELVARGARRVYAAARHPERIDLDGVVPLPLDVTDSASVRAAVEAAPDVTMLINNAGISTFARLIDGDVDDVRREMDTNYFGTLAMIRAFAGPLARNGGGAILNVLSVMAWLGYEHSNSYGASKAAAWALTNGLRVELTEQGTQVSGLFLGSTDTDMMAAFDVPKNRPEDVVATAIDGVLAGELEILADQASTDLRATLSLDPAVRYPNVARVA